MAQALALDFTPFTAPAVTPSSRPLGRLGMFRTLRTNVLELYGRESYRQLNFIGPFFGRRSLFTNDPIAIRRVLVDDADAFTRTEATFRVLAPILGNGLFLSEGADWKFQRRTLAPAFAPRAMDIVASVTAEVADQQIAEIKRLPDQPVDLMRTIQTLALDIAGRTMFSMPMEKRGTDLREAFEGYGMALGQPYPLDILLPQGVPSPRDLRRWIYGRHWKGLIRSLVDQRRRLPPVEGAARDLFDLMSEARDPETGRGLTFDELCDQFATFIIAGHETTALTLLWSLILLAESPGLQSAMAAEANAADLNVKSAAKLREKLPLTRAVVNESLRLFPPAFLIVRKAARPITVAGHRLAKGDLVNISPWVLHRHEQHWKDPETFDPTRFLPGVPAPDKYVYLPFGVGPRVCIGAQFALTEATIALARFLQSFEVRLKDPVTVKPVAIVTTYPDPVPMFRVAPRVV